MDAKEISQVVFADCKDYIDGLKKEYGELLVQEVYEKVSQQYAIKIDRLEKDNKKLLKRLEKIESKIESLDDDLVNDDSSLLSLLGYNNNKESKKSYPKSAYSNKVNIDPIFKMRAFEYNGWYYYANEKMGNFLYRVRIDGTDNEQLTDYSVNMAFASVKDGRLYFRDSSSHERSITL